MSRWRYVAIAASVLWQTRDVFSIKLRRTAVPTPKHRCGTETDQSARGTNDHDHRSSDETTSARASTDKQGWQNLFFIIVSFILLLFKTLKTRPIKMSLMSFILA